MSLPPKQINQDWQENLVGHQNHKRWSCHLFLQQSVCTPHTKYYKLSLGATFTWTPYQAHCHTAWTMTRLWTPLPVNLWIVINHVSNNLRMESIQICAFTHLITFLLCVPNKTKTHPKAMIRRHNDLLWVYKKEILDKRQNLLHPHSFFPPNNVQKISKIQMSHWCQSHKTVLQRIW